MLYRELEQALVIGFLVDFRTGLHNGLVDVKKARVGKSVARICLFRERAAEVQIQPFHAVRTEQVLQVFSLTQAETHVLYVAVHERLGTGDEDVRGLFHCDVVYIGVSPRKFQNEAALSAADFKMQRIVVAEHLHAVEEKAVVQWVVCVFVLVLHYQHNGSAGFKALLKMLLFSHSHWFLPLYSCRRAVYSARRQDIW